MADALEPLRLRYLSWLGRTEDEIVADREEAAEEIRAMQLVLRLERGTDPSWHTAVRLAATAAARLCLDPRAEPGGPWHDAIAAYCAGHIRKVTRRARGAHWSALADLPGITLTERDTEVIALLPGRIAELDKRVSRLQVGGTDAPVDAPPAEDAAGGSGVLRLWLPPEPVMTLGKTMAQAGHAGMIAAALLAADDGSALAEWAAAGCPTTAHRVDGGAWRMLHQRIADPAQAWQGERLLAVRDAGFTEIDPGTVTVIARAPAAVPGAGEREISFPGARDPGSAE